MANPNDVVIVAARNAWPEYNELHAYICQPKRSFQQVTRVGFYSRGSIHPLVPKILATYDEVTLVKDRHDGELGMLVQRLLLEGRRPERGLFKILMLSAPDVSVGEFFQLEVDRDVAFQESMIKHQIDKVMLVTDSNASLASFKTKAVAQLHQELLQFV